MRKAMRRETEMFFGHVVREDRPVTELIDSNYIFVNEKLAQLYGMPDVTGPEMRKVGAARRAVRAAACSRRRARCSSPRIPTAPRP